MHQTDHTCAVYMYYFVAVQDTSTTKLPAFFEKILKTVRAQKINETKLTLKNVFIDNVFTVKSEKESRNGKRTLF